MKIRKLRDDDIGKIVAMIHDVMGPADAKKALTDIKISLTPNAYKFEEFYVVDIDGEIAAAGGFWSLQYDPDIARLDWFVVPKKHQGKGFGSMLMNFIVREARARKLRLILAEVSDGSKYKPAREFLSKQGYEKAATIKNYWEDGSGVVYLVKRL